ncbi:MAG TPA: 2-oxo-4-hydroxy-4-carboxy-5-ureidoimidazoline decarboxylase [Chloroflexia bacterium]|nr:2-oxo-4-hydroxy-4-carboxy-5-ureidoimidazoline decarboxylase [Chloroflexia bacterium]
MTRPSVTLRELNADDQATFARHLTAVFEGHPAFVARAWLARPFADLEALHDALTAALAAAPLDEKLALIAAHPDLVGAAARAGTLGPESAREQAAAGLGRLAPDEVATFTQWNTAYRAKFGFPFVICARENKKEAILAAFPARLAHSRPREIETALREIAKIAWLRLVDLVAPE